jgi:predicted RNA-binding protein with PIN domain
MLGEDAPVDGEPVPLAGLGLAIGPKREAASRVQIELEARLDGWRARCSLRVDDELETTGWARKGLVPELRHDPVGNLVGERRADDSGHVEVALSGLVAAESPRPAGVDADQLGPEKLVQAPDELVEVRALGFHAGILSEMLYLFDGYNILHAGSFREREELIDRLASFVAMRGARGVVVFDGVGEDTSYGDLAVRFAAEADAVIERLAAEHRGQEEVWVISSDREIRGTAGQETRRVSSKNFLRDLDESAKPAPGGRSQIEDALDENTRSALERLRRRRH